MKLWVGKETVGKIAWPIGIDQFTNFMHTILTKVVPDNLKACPRFVQRSNN